MGMSIGMGTWVQTWAGLGRKQIVFSWLEPALLAASISLLAFQLWLNYLPFTGWVDSSGRYFGNDFANFWLGPRLAFAGKADILPSLPGYFAEFRKQFGNNIGAYYNWSYPPHALLLFWPLAQLNYFVAYVLFTAGFLAVFLITALKVLRPAAPVRFLLLTAFAPACLFNILCGQNGFVTGSLIVGAIASTAARPWLAGLLLGLLSFKPQLGILMPVVLAARRAWLAIGVAGLTICGLVLASLALFGQQPWIDHLTITAANQRWLLEHDLGYYAQMFVSPYAVARTLGFTYYAALAVQGALSLLLLVVVAKAFRLPQATLADRLLILCLAIPLSVPYSMAYDLPAAGMLLAFQLCQPNQTRFRLFCYSAGWLSPAFVWMAEGQSNGIVQVGLMLSLWAAWRQACAEPPNNA